MAINPGILTSRVFIQTPVLNTNSLGEIEITDWDNEATRWASIEPVSGREFWNAQQVQADVTHIITLREYDLTPDYRIKDVLYGTIYHIESVIHKDNMTELMCKEWLFQPDIGV